MCKVHNSNRQRKMFSALLLVQCWVLLLVPSIPGSAAGMEPGCKTAISFSSVTGTWHSCDGKKSIRFFEDGSFTWKDLSFQKLLLPLLSEKLLPACQQLFDKHGKYVIVGKNRIRLYHLFPVLAAGVDIGGVMNELRVFAVFTGSDRMIIEYSLLFGYCNFAGNIFHR